jgi:hypothetical protein
VTVILSSDGTLSALLGYLSALGLPYDAYLSPRTGEWSVVVRGPR